MNFRSATDGSLRTDRRGGSLSQPRSHPRAASDFNSFPFDPPKGLRSILETFWKQNPRRFKPFIENIERNMIVYALTSVFGNQKEAARILGLKATTLNMKIKRYRIVFEKKYRHPGGWFFLVR